MAEVTPQERPETAVYSGWGPYKERNQGDDLCHQAATMLLEGSALVNVKNIRHSLAPVIDPWEHDLVVGGGTVLPTVFDSKKAPGLKSASRIFVFGSGCLSPEELDLKGVSSFDREPFERTQVIGVRGPLSAKNYRKFFDKAVPYIGDLAFALTPDSPVDLIANGAQNKISFFIIENPPVDVERLNATQSEVVGLYTDLADTLDANTEVSRVFVTNQYQDNSFYERFGLERHFDDYERATTAGKLIETIRDSSLVVTERLHPAIVAASQGIPFIYLQTTSKSRDLEQLLEVHSGGAVDGSCFYDMSSRPLQPLIKSYKKVTVSPELPHALFAASQSVRDCLQTAAGQLISELCS